MRDETSANADYSKLRYAQCWEDADVLLDALNIQPGQTCLSIASAGDNTLAMLSKGPARVIAVDVNPAQLAALELRVAAYRELSHAELLMLIGSRPSDERASLYARCRNHLSDFAREFWDAHRVDIRRGIGGAGKFERYFRLFRTRVLPLVHSRVCVERLLEGHTREKRIAFYDEEWDTWRWRLLFQIFFSRFVMGRLGRAPSCFKYVKGSVADRILDRTRYALTELNPAENPYIQWILKESHTTALPYSLRPENFQSVRNHLDRLEWRCEPLETALEAETNASIDCFNLSDVFEYMPQDQYEQILKSVVRAGKHGARIVYWNMLAERHRPDSMRDLLKPLTEVARSLHARDRAFFYSALVVEEVV